MEDIVPLEPNKAIAKARQQERWRIHLEHAYKLIGEASAEVGLHLTPPIAPNEQSGEYARAAYKALEEAAELLRLAYRAAKEQA